MCDKWGMEDCWSSETVSEKDQKGSTDDGHYAANISFTLLCLELQGTYF